MDRLIVSTQNPHLLATEGGDPLLIIGDTAWELFHRLTLPEIELYLATRARQGFNMIWANILPEFNGLTEPNRNGDLPFEDLDPLKPVESYFEFIDEVVAMAASKEIHVGLLPTWGDKLTAPWGAGPVLFHLDNLEVSRSYARWLGTRYASQPNVIWVLGGDRPPRLFGPADQFPKRNAVEAGLDAETDWTPIWREFASGLREGGATQLIGYHPQGGPHSTSEFLHGEPWLDFNAIQSGHGGGHDVPIWNWIERDYNLSPLKPTMDAEPNYEDHPVNPWPVWDPKNGFFEDYDVRKQVYRSIFAGGCGVIYGNHCVWQFASELYGPVLEVRMPWQQAILQPGAEQMRHLRDLIESIGFGSIRPDQSLIVNHLESGQGLVRVARTDDCILVYSAAPAKLQVHLPWSGEDRVVVSIFETKTGEVVPLYTTTGASTPICDAFGLRQDHLTIYRREQDQAKWIEPHAWRNNQQV